MDFVKAEKKYKNALNYWSVKLNKDAKEYVLMYPQTLFIWINFRKINCKLNNNEINKKNRGWIRTDWCCLSCKL